MAQNAFCEFIATWQQFGLAVQCRCTVP